MLEVEFTVDFCWWGLGVDCYFGSVGGATLHIGPFRMDLDWSAE